MTSVVIPELQYVQKHMPEREPIGILFLCTGNSCRSQMAAGWARHLKADVIAPLSAGTDPQPLNPLAIRAMREVGVDISDRQPTHVKDLRCSMPDYVITVCDAAAESCPEYPADVPVIHVSFEDPPKLAQNARNEEEAMIHYRRVRDEIRALVDRLPGWLEQRQGG